MEESNDDIIYDLEAALESHAEVAEEQSAKEKPEISECSEEIECSEGSKNREGSDESDSHDGNEESPADPAREEIRRMVEEMGAETLLEIIRDNRNAAIRQIISEVEATQRHDLPSGASAARKPTSIFDLAALA